MEFEYSRKSILTLVLLLLLIEDIVVINGQSGVTEVGNQLNVISALIRYSYFDPDTGEHLHEQGEYGRYASSSPVNPVSGLVVHVRSKDGANHGCDAAPPHNQPSTPEDWVALVQRGTCSFSTKIENSAVVGNASAVIIYNNVEVDYLITMDHKIDHIVSVFISKRDGEKLASLADSGIDVELDISIGQITVYDIVSNQGLKSSTLLAITVSVVALLVLGLVILLICAINKRRTTTNSNNNNNNKKKQANKAMVFNLRNPGQVHEGLLSAIDAHDQSSHDHSSHDHSSDHKQAVAFLP